MGIFSKKPHYSFSDVIKGLQQAVNSAQEMLQAQQIQNLSKFWDSQNNAPLTQKVTVGDQQLEVPLFTMVPHHHLQMDEVEISFNAKVGDVADGAVQGLKGMAQSHANLQMALEGVNQTDDDVMHITIKFKSSETPEGVSRLVDQYNKYL